MRDKDDALASLGASDASAVNHPVGPPIPEAFQSQDDCGHVASAIACEETVCVFKNCPAWTSGVHESEVFCDESLKLPVEVRVLSGESGATASLSNDEVFAGEPSDQDVGVSQIGSADIFNVLSPRHVRPVSGQHAALVLVNFNLGSACHSGAVETEVEAADSCEQ
jgi:hypothetical protein